MQPSASPSSAGEISVAIGSGPSIVTPVRICSWFQTLGDIHDLLSIT